jgi:hypothetical protein
MVGTQKQGLNVGAFSTHRHVQKSPAILSGFKPGNVVVPATALTNLATLLQFAFIMHINVERLWYSCENKLKTKRSRFCLKTFFFPKCT